MNAFGSLLHLKSHRDLQMFNQLNTVIWVFSIDDHKFWWANRPALKFWDVTCLEEFLAIDLSDDSPVVRERLAEIFKSGADGKPIEENWTLYPGGKPKMVILTFTPILVENKKRAVLIEASPELREELDPRAKRILEAVRHTPLMISTFTKDGQLLAQNPRSAQTYLENQDHVVTLFHRYGDADFVEELITATQKMEKFVSDIQVMTVDGLRWHNLTADTGRDPVSGDVVIVVTEKDVHERLNAQVELEQLNATLEQRVAERTHELSEAIQEAETANKAKTDFLATMSHELRTPLNAIIGFSEMLTYQVYGPITDRQKTTLDDINKSGRHLLTQINDLLDASTIDRGELNLFEATFSIRSVLEYCQTIFEIEAQKKKQNLIFNMPGADLFVKADEHRYTQILSNLLANAVKYTPENGTITIDTIFNKIEGVIISIADTGIGISSDKLESVTQAFTQIDISSSFISGKGVGLGLYITSNLLSAHGGRLQLDSQELVGTTARAILPGTRLVMAEL